MKEFHGVSAGHYVADEDLNFHGIAKSGLTVRVGIKVCMHGVLQGPVVLEKGALLTVYGLLEGEIDDQGGKIVVHGATNGDRPRSSHRSRR